MFTFAQVVWMMSATLLAADSMYIDKSHDATEENRNTSIDSAGPSPGSRNANDTDVTGLDKYPSGTYKLRVNGEEVTLVIIDEDNQGSSVTNDDDLLDGEIDLTGNYIKCKAGEIGVKIEGKWNCGSKIASAKYN